MKISKNPVPVVFLHGLKGGPNGTKGVFLRKRFPYCLTPRLPENMHQRMAIVREIVKEPSWIVGSSLGGLNALFFAMQSPELVRGMVLIAPAVGFHDPSFCTPQQSEKIRSTYIPRGIPCNILAGKRDTLIPLSDIVNLVERSQDKRQIELLELDDDHSLNRSLDIMLEKLEAMMAQYLLGR